MERWTREEAEGYRARWRFMAVGEGAPDPPACRPADRLRELSMLFDAARLCGGDPGREKGVARVRRRWARLRRVARG
ncbi:MAG: hypothetical protein L6R43_11655 [Planctomycetes bacterium]|nr:hypothetical protein [Planctomycetota bacterium]